MNSWKPPVTLEEIQHIVDTLGMEKFVQVVKTALHFQAAYALKNLNGKTSHPNIYLVQKGYDISVVVYVPDRVRVRVGGGKLWTEPLPLFRGEALDFKDPKGDWHFKLMFDEESFRTWMMAETRIWDENAYQEQAAVVVQPYEELVNERSL